MIHSYSYVKYLKQTMKRKMKDRKENKETKFCRRKWNLRYYYWSLKVRSQSRNKTEPAPAKRIGVCRPLTGTKNCSRWHQRHRFGTCVMYWTEITWKKSPCASSVSNSDCLTRTSWNCLATLRNLVNVIDVKKAVQTNFEWKPPRSLFSCLER